MYVSEPTNKAPSEFENELQQLVYQKLEEMRISYLRVDCEDGTTMEDCLAIDAALDAKTVKTLFLCNRQQTRFYLFVTEGDKPFVTKEFSGALEVSRVSFAPEEKLVEIMGTRIGATTVFSCLLPSSEDVMLVFDKDVLNRDTFCCTDGTHTGFVKFKTEDLKKILESIGREYEVI